MQYRLVDKGGQNLKGYILVKNITHTHQKTYSRRGLQTARDPEMGQDQGKGPVYQEL